MLAYRLHSMLAYRLHSMLAYRLHSMLAYRLHSMLAYKRHSMLAYKRHSMLAYKTRKVPNKVEKHQTAFKQQCNNNNNQHTLIFTSACSLDFVVFVFLVDDMEMIEKKKMGFFYKPNPKKNQ
jgi:hypothetical protein